MNSKISSRFMFTAIILLMLFAKNANAQFTWEDSFTNAVNPTSNQLDTWNAFKAGLVPEADYSSILISGSLDEVGIGCSDPAKAAEFANLLNTDTSGIVSCDGHEWALCATRYSGEVWIDPPSLCDANNCPSPGNIIRVGIGNSNWGGIGTATCDAPSQTMRLEFNAELLPPADATPVPTMSQWALIMLSMLLGLLVFTNRKRLF